MRYLIIFFFIVNLNVSFAQDSEKIDEIISSMNAKLAEKKTGSVCYVHKIKPLLSNKNYRHVMDLFFDKNQLNDDSLGSFILKTGDDFFRIFFHSQVYTVYTPDKLITVFSTDTLNNTSVEKLAFSNNFRLFKPFIRTKHFPFTLTRDYSSKSLSEDFLYGKNCYKISLSLIDTATAYGEYDSTTYYITKENYSLLKYESKLYQKEADDVQITVFDSIGIVKSSFPGGLSIEKYLDSLFHSGNKIEYNNPYAQDSSVAAIDTMTYAPDWQATDSSGNKIRLSEIKSRYVLFDFSYLSCYYCFKAMPMLNKLFATYNRKDLSVFWIDPVDYEKRKYVESVFLKKGITYPVYYDIDRSVVKQYGIYGYPTMLLVELPSRKILKRIVGYDSSGDEELDIIIQNLLKN